MHVARKIGPIRVVDAHDSCCYRFEMQDTERRTLFQVLTSVMDVIGLTLLGQPNNGC
jgi:hypothetical protein